MVLEWAEGIVAVSIGRSIVVTITRGVVAVVVITSSVHARIASIVIRFRFIPISNFYSF